MGYFFENEYNLDDILKSSRMTFNLTDCLTPRTNRKISDLLQNLLSKMGRFFNIERGALSFLDTQNEKMRITHMLKNGHINTGVTLVIKNKNSIMHQTLDHGFPIADNFPEHISNSTIEKKILMSENTRSVLMIPLITNSVRIGVLSLSSKDECTFGTYLEGMGKGFVDEFTDQLYQMLTMEKIGV
jgi:transcriptional regulator with GAF, ATPase, and Fis domain